MGFSPISATNLGELAAMQAVAQSAYVHVPFCRRRCFYCDFPISVLGDQLRGTASGTVTQYVEWLCEEIAAAPAAAAPLQTVFFGGGTPSLLDPSQLERILAALDQSLGIDSGAEISMEMDPGTFDWAQLKGYRDLGVNRISLGVQAFEDEFLQACGRTHTVQAVRQAIDWLHRAAVPNWSLDLISGLPHQTLDRWESGLEAAISTHPTHLSVYDLTIEAETVFHRRYQPGSSPLPTDDQTADMYRLTQRVLTAHGYEHYEISNYARPGHQCRHNLTYWENRPFYGFGMGATSYLNGQRISRPRTLRAYRQWLTDGMAHPDLVSQNSATAEALAVDSLLDHLMVGLRLAAGVSRASHPLLRQEFFWQTVLQVLQPHIQQGWVVVETEAMNPNLPPDGLQTRIRLTDPEGFLFSNQVLVDLFNRLAQVMDADSPG